MSHSTLPDEITKAKDLSEVAQKLGLHLGLDSPAPLAAAKRACSDELYARALHSLRKLPQMRDLVLAAANDVKTNEPSGPTNSELVKKAANSVLKWGMDGLKPSEPWIIEKRLAACNACDKQVPAPNTLIYKGATIAVGKDAKICATCNCLTNTKAAIPTEKCPERAMDNPNLSRWGEPWEPIEEHPEGPW